MRVKAIGINEGYVGYYNMVRRRAGDVFDLLRDSDFTPKWMEEVKEDTEKTEAPGEPSKADLVEDKLLDPDWATKASSNSKSKK